MAAKTRTALIGPAATKLSNMGGEHMTPLAGPQTRMPARVSANAIPIGANTSATATKDRVE